MRAVFMESFADSARASFRKQKRPLLRKRTRRSYVSTIYNNLLILVSTSLVFSVGERCLIAATSLSIIQLHMNYVLGIVNSRIDKTARSPYVHGTFMYLLYVYA